MRYDNYKFSGEAWLGYIPAEWKVVPIKRVAAFNPGHTVKFSNSDVVGYAPMDRIRFDNMIPSTIKVKDCSTGLTYFEENDVVLAKVTPCFENGNVAVAPKMEHRCGFGSSELFVYRCKSLLRPRFLMYYFQNRSFVDSGAATMTGTGGLKRVSSSFARNAAIPLPTLEEQDKIVAFLDKQCRNIDSIIAAKQRQIELLEEYKQAIIAQAVTRGLNPDVKMKFMDTPLQCKHPEHWKRVRNMSFMIEQSDSVGKNSNDFALLSLTTNGVILRDMESGKGKFPKDFESYSKVEPNEIIFCLFDIDETPRTVGLSRNYGMITGAYDIFKIKESLVLPEYVYYYYLAIDNIKALRPYYSGLRKVVKHNRFMQIGFPLPPMEEQIEIVAYIKAKSASIDNLKATITQEISLLQEYKQRLISDVVTGQINVQNEIV